MVVTGYTTVLGWQVCHPAKLRLGGGMPHTYTAPRVPHRNNHNSHKHSALKKH
uniref:Uncharacterized protein n=1 Tax=Anguilla anguilla TaxID=7936 RepID=A0A0E9XAD6_ANGAN